MDFYVYDTDLNAVGIIDNYTSVIWTLRYNDVGDFEIYIKSTPEILELCQIGRYVVRKSDNTVMVIKSITQSDSVENGNYITIKGKSIETILSQRIVWNVTIITGRVEECVFSLIDTNCINPTDSARKINTLSLSPLKRLTAQIPETTFTPTNLIDAIKTLCNAANYGFKIVFKNGGLVFEIYDGVDRSRNQNVNPYVIFDVDNISEMTYTNDSENYKNAALVGGSGDYISKMYSSYGSATGLNRFETYIETNDVSDRDALAAFGRDALQEYKNVKTLDGEIGNYYTYGVNYSLGDIVEIETQNGITAMSRIVEIIQSIDDSGIYTIPKFAEWEVD